MSETRNIGIPVNPPKTSCNDPDCPFHGKLTVRGILLSGVVYKKKMDKTVVVENEHTVYVKKYKRYMRRRSRISAPRSSRGTLTGFWCALRPTRASADSARPTGAPGSPS
ncbi:MAG: 30S ribosomal protein S17 [Candidatus Caldarchaeum sp.]